MNGVDPYAYLRDVLTRIVARHPMSRIDELLPFAYPPAQSPLNIGAKHRSKIAEAILLRSCAGTPPAFSMTVASGSTPRRQARNPTIALIIISSQECGGEHWPSSRRSLKQAK
jgi:hypothetical protein